MTSETMHDVKSAAAVLADDVICQSFTQSSSTLAYACLLIRRKRYDLAVHVLHSLEAKQASRFKDMVFYLQAQIGIETGEYAMVKKRLVPRVHQHPNDMVALSLLECSVYHEWVEWAKGRPAQEPQPVADAGRFAATANAPPAVSGSLFGNPEAAASAAYAAAFENAPADAADANDTPLSGLLEIRPASPATSAASASAAVPHSISVSIPPTVRPAPPKPAPSTPVTPAAAARPVFTAPAPGADGDVGIYQTLANDQNTHAMVVWNAEKGKFKSSCRNPLLETLVGILPQEVPAAIQSACASLDGGSIHKICFSFQTLTVTTFHSGAENMGLITGHINQSLLTIVRAENTFRKQAASVAQASRPAEYAPNE